MTLSTLAPDTISRYLANRLSERERADFEGLCVAHPEIVRDMETTLRLREGLAQLRDRGELAPRLAARRRALPAAAWGVAATLVAAAMAVLLWARPWHPPAGLLSSAVPKNPAIGQTYTLVASRGPGSVISVPAPSIGLPVEIRALPEYPATTGRYRIAIARLQGEAAPQVLGVLTRIAPRADGFVVAYASAAALPPGRYRVTVAADEPAAATHASEFTLQLVAIDQATLRAP